MDVSVFKPNFPRFNYLSLWLAIGLSLAPVSAVLAQNIIAQYSGGENPLKPNTGTLWASAGRASFGKETSDPLPAWKIKTEEGQALSFGFVPNDADVAEAFQNGWRMVAKVRLDTSELATYKRYAAAFGFESVEPKAEWIASVVVDEGGGLILDVNRSRFPLPGLAESDYHTYEMVYKPENKTVQVLVDGQPIEGEVKSGNGDKTRIVWGNTSIQAVSAAEWASVKFEIVKP